LYVGIVVCFYCR